MNYINLSGRDGNNKINCYVYGIGKQYNVLASYLNLYQDKINILGLVTTEPQGITYLDGKRVIRSWEMEIDELDYVIIATEQYKEVFHILKDMGLSDRILRSYIFSIPNFALEDYLRLRKSRPSILSNTCLAGFVYHDLGLEMLSPTINVRCNDYIQFLRNYKAYLSVDIEVEANDFLAENIYWGEAFAPKGTFGDSVYWWFIHAEDGKSEAEKWNRRRHYVNYDNIIALMIIMTDEEAYDFDRLPIKRKLGFYYKDLKLESVLYTPEWNDTSLQHQFNYQYAVFIHRYYARNVEKAGKIDWIRFLNGEDDFLRF